MRVQLFIPCYVDQFFPNVAIASLELLEKLGCEVVYPLHQTCCGQPMANTGYAHLASACDSNFAANFNGADYIVCPSGSCTLHIKEHLHVSDTTLQHNIRKHVYELNEFIVDVLGVKKIKATFPYKVGYHASCHGQRGLHLSSMSELMVAAFSKPAMLLQSVEGLSLYYPKRADECCGFGGTFCVTEEAVSVKMGVDRLQEHVANGVTYITGNDMSCLMHLQGIIDRQSFPLQTIHIAEILNKTETLCR